VIRALVSHNATEQRLTSSISLTSDTHWQPLEGVALQVAAAAPAPRFDYQSLNDSRLEVSELISVRQTLAAGGVSY
jgi:hypothetical protein